MPCLEHSNILILSYREVYGKDFIELSNFKFIEYPSPLFPSEGMLHFTLRSPDNDFYVKEVYTLQRIQ